MLAMSSEQHVLNCVACCIYIPLHDINTSTLCSDFRKDDTPQRGSRSFFPSFTKRDDSQIERVDGEEAWKATH